MADRAVVLGVSVDRIDMEMTVRRIEDLVERRVGAQHVSINAAKIVLSHRNARMREIIQQCEIVSADGQAVVWASRLLRDPLPERVAGIDLMLRLLDLAENRSWGVYILGARPDVLEAAVDRLRRQHPRLRVVGAQHGYFTDAEAESVCVQIAAARPELLFVAMNSPRKELWLADHRDHLAIPFVMGVGGSIDVIAGIARRAPPVLQRAGLEWLYRLVQEPRRLFGRYVKMNTMFVLLLAREAIRTRRCQLPARPEKQ